MIPGRVEFSLRAAERAGEQLRHLAQVPAAMVAPVACLAHRLPRYFGAACHFTGYAQIGLTWAYPPPCA